MRERERESVCVCVCVCVCVKSGKFCVCLKKLVGSVHVRYVYIRDCDDFGILEPHRNYLLFTGVVCIFSFFFVAYLLHNGLYVINGAR